MSNQIGRDTVEALDTHMEGLLEDWGGERLDNIDAAQRTLLTLCRRIVDGEMAPAAGAAVIGRLQHLSVVGEVAVGDDQTVLRCG
jgi:hypothetical protein